jgi:hypothetical protein
MRNYDFLYKSWYNLPQQAQTNEEHPKNQVFGKLLVHLDSADEEIFDLPRTDPYTMR